MSDNLILVPLAEGFEETEAIAIVDVLRRASLEVVTASLAKKLVMGAHGVAVEADLLWDEVDQSEVHAIVLPGGMPGTTNLRDDPRVLELVRRLSDEGRLTAAVCAAPLVLAEAGVLDGGVPFTCHPSTRPLLEAHSPLEGPRVILSGSVITSQGPGTALEFALACVEHLVGGERAGELAEAMMVPRGG